MKPHLPWRRHREQMQQNRSAQAWWRKLWASRSAWTLVGGAVVFVLTQGVESLANLRKLPSEAIQTLHLLQSWYYDDASWTGTWSSREEGNVEDYRQSDVPIKISLGTERGVVVGEMFNRTVCEGNPMISYVLVEGEIIHGKLLARAFTHVGGQRRYLYSFQAHRSRDEPVITLTPKQDPSGLLPAAARLVQRPERPHSEGSLDASSEEDHPDLSCAESPIQYLQRLRKEGKLRGLDELRRAKEADRPASAP